MKKSFNISNLVKENEQQFITAIENKDSKKIKSLFNKIPTVDLAEYSKSIEYKESLFFIFQVINTELAADYFIELEHETQTILLNLFTNDDLKKFINVIHNDDIVDILQRTPNKLRNRILKLIPLDRQKIIVDLINKTYETAASIMTTEYFGIEQNTKVNDALEYIKEKGKIAETVYTVFLIDNNKKLVGTVDLDDLVFADPESKLKDIKNKEFIFTKESTDQEAVAKLFKKYDTHAIGVVNNNRELTGVITIDDIVDVIEAEDTEDIAMRAGVVAMKENYENVGAFKMALKCVPWLIVLIVLGLFSSMVISSFENYLKSAVVLIAFIPVLMDASGDAGGQTCSIVIRSLALKDFSKKDFFKLLWKEIRTAALIGAMVASVAFVAFFGEQFVPWLVKYNGNVIQKLVVAAVTASALFFTIICSKFFACILPFIVKKFGKDPAFISEPIVTTIADLCALVIYFAIVSIALGAGFSFI